MLVVIPLAAFALTFYLLYVLQPGQDWRRAFLHAAVLWAVCLVLATELLSLFHLVTSLGLALAWFLLLLGIGWCLYWLFKAGRLVRLPSLSLPKRWMDRILLAGVVVIMAITALVAWLSPPQTWDALNYHLPRVAHWAQERAVRHFTTGIDVQNSMPPGAEMIILNFYVLLRGDRLATFVEWFAMAACLVGASYLAKQLGADQSGQLLAAAITAAIPVGIVQASSTMTDYVVALWVVCAVSEVLSLLDQPKIDTLLFASLAAGLALLTKPTAAVYLVPFALLAAYGLVRRLGFWHSLRWAAIAVALVLVLNTGALGRNTLTYGNPISGKERIDKQVNELMTLPGMLSNVLRNAGLHLGTPKQSVNQWIFDQVAHIHDWIGVDINDPRTTLHGEYNPISGFALHEDVVGNLFHAGLVVITFLAALIARKRLGNRTLVYVLLVTSTFFLFSLVFKWQIFGTRYFMPFFVLFAPAISLVLTRLLSPTVAGVIGILLLLAGFPWLFSINSRPLVATDQSYVSSILHTPRQELYFANGTHLEKPFTTMTNQINAAGCSKVGIMLSGGNAEYPLWVLLGAPRRSLEIEWLVSGTPTDRYTDPNFQPCAIICQKCPQDWQTLRGLPIAYDDGAYRLYLQP
jgi:hypothetical protein